jgi:hypothetical protein
MSSAAATRDIRKHSNSESFELLVMDRSATTSGVSIDECKLSSRVAQVAQLVKNPYRRLFYTGTSPPV